MLKSLLPKTCFALCILMGLLAACSSNSSPSGSQTNSGGQEATPLPTLTTIPIFNFVQPTFPPQLQTLAAASTSEASPSAVSTSEAEATAESISEASSSTAAGQQIYVALTCNSCHGDKGEGTTKGSALTSFSMSEDAFVSFLRSGGTIGSTHIYGTDRLSDADAKTLYTYLQSLVTK